MLRRIDDLLRSTCSWSHEGFLRASSFKPKCRQTTSPAFVFISDFDQVYTNGHSHEIHRAGRPVAITELIVEFREGVIAVSRAPLDDFCLETTKTTPESLPCAQLFVRLTHFRINWKASLVVLFLSMAIVWMRTNEEMVFKATRSKIVNYRTTNAIPCLPVSRTPSRGVRTKHEDVTVERAALRRTLFKQFVAVAQPVE